jgi:hypothetical protein
MTINAELLIEGLSHPDPAFRLNMARILLLVDETAALEALAAAFHAEPVPDVKQALSAAGKHLQALRQQGYTTLNEIFRAFAIDREIAHLESDPEKKALERLRYQAHLDAEAERARLMARGVFVGAPSAPPSSDDDLPKRRAPPTQPTTVDLRAHLRRLEDPLAEKRRKAVLDLAALNNPAALPYLAALHVLDAAALVREQAKRSGKQVYLNAVYWEMEQDGRIAAEYQRRMQAAGKKPAAPDTLNAEQRRAREQQQAADILRRAHEQREKRKGPK